MKLFLPLAIFSAMFLSGCASKEYVHEYVQSQLNPVSSRVGNLEGKADVADVAIKATDKRLDGAVAEIQGGLKAHAERIAKNEVDIAQLSRTAQDAMNRADAAGKLAQGKLLYEVVLTEDKLKFGSSKTGLSKDAKAALDEFAAKLKADNKNVFVEIQGHTDSIGEAAPNLRLGEVRAEAVRRYLNMQGGIPLHRMAVISYGETAPVASNKLKAGREQNRRVALVVLQ